MDFGKAIDQLRAHPGTTQAELEQIRKGILAMATDEPTAYTWEQKIDGLAELAKVVGTYLEVEIEDPGSDGHKETRERLKEAYDEFCQWRHDEPYVVDEIKALLASSPPAA